MSILISLFSPKSILLSQFTKRLFHPKPFQNPLLNHKKMWIMWISSCITLFPTFFVHLFCGQPSTRIHIPFPLFRCFWTKFVHFFTFPIQIPWICKIPENNYQTFPYTMRRFIPIPFPTLTCVSQYFSFPLCPASPRSLFFCRNHKTARPKDLTVSLYVIFG